jgi:hypothetical protein
VTDPEIASRLKAILALPEFQPDGMDQFWAMLRHFLSSFRGWIDRLGSLQRWSITLAALALLLFILFHLARGYRDALDQQTPRGPGGPPERESRAPDPGSLAMLARRLAEKGDPRAGARALQQAVLVALSRRARLPWNPTAADWEWLTLLRQVEGLADFTRNAQTLAFGPDPTREAFDACWLQSRAWFGSAP